jgi:8-oxo-dGTP pyrophosphatase MutT (NUDIX family)
LTPAAVLLPIIARQTPTVLFTRRTATLSKHAGQVSFPGGRVEADDLSPLETALRETHEETGIASDFVSVAGFMEGYETGTGFAILPVVGVLHEGFALVPEPSEVAEIFEVPLSFLLDLRNCERKSGEWQGHKRDYYAFTYGTHYIWGATAAILVNFAQKLTAP